MSTFQQMEVAFFGASPALERSPSLFFLKKKDFLKMFQWVTEWESLQLGTQPGGRSVGLQTSGKVDRTSPVRQEFLGRDPPKEVTFGGRHSITIHRSHRKNSARLMVNYKLTPGRRVSVGSGPVIAKRMRQCMGLAVAPGATWAKAPSHMESDRDI